MDCLGQPYSEQMVASFKRFVSLVGDQLDGMASSFIASIN